MVIQLHGILGNRWAVIASQLPGRADNDIKNQWNTHLKKRLLRMGLDPNTHESFSPCGPTTTKPTSPATLHMAQWESVKLEAEDRLSNESLLFKPDSDHFLRLWNSEVGESFRKLNKEDKTICRSPISQASSSTKCGLIPGPAVDIGPNIAASNQIEDVERKISNSSCSNESEDSSDTALKLLLDFPFNNDMSFLENVDTCILNTPS